MQKSCITSRVVQTSYILSYWIFCYSDVDWSMLKFWKFDICRIVSICSVVYGQQLFLEDIRQDTWL